MSERVGAIWVGTLEVLHGGVGSEEGPDISAAGRVFDWASHNRGRIQNWFYMACAGLVAEQATKVLVDVDPTDYRRALWAGARIGAVAGLTYLVPKFPAIARKLFEPAVEEERLFNLASAQAGGLQEQMYPIEAAGVQVIL